MLTPLLALFRVVSVCLSLFTIDLSDSIDAGARLHQRDDISGRVVHVRTPRIVILEAETARLNMRSGSSLIALHARVLSLHNSLQGLLNMSSDIQECARLFFVAAGVEKGHEYCVPHWCDACVDVHANESFVYM